VISGPKHGKGSQPVKLWGCKPETVCITAASAVVVLNISGKGVLLFTPVKFVFKVPSTDVEHKLQIVKMKMTATDTHTCFGSPFFIWNIAPKFFDICCQMT
jgi:hypothetical protein